MLQLRARLEMIHRMGIDTLVQEHRKRAVYFRERIQPLPLTLFAARPSNALTALAVDPPHNALKIVQELEQRYRIYAAPNPPPFADKIFRVGHFGDQPLEHLDIIIDKLKNILIGI
jgi:alanine-glyoxylate transaminase/serine-glyoxylate transaminase/serine-pyruvate transaminase